FFRSVVNAIEFRYARCMGRPRQYDTETALDAAQVAFWSHGYASTSVADLCTATGLKKGSLYQAFGDKHALFMRVLDRYLAGGRAMFVAIGQAEPDAVVPSIRAWLTMASAGACVQSGPGGCMAVNSLVELGPHDAAVESALAAHFGALREALRTALTRAQQAGIVRSDRAADDLARYLETMVSGLATGGRGGQSGAAPGLIDIAIDALSTPAA
ncbi:MAG: TetR/AcrR family transcriptional repressor of nem operon, partial [Bradymonadia bacterium]